MIQRAEANHRVRLIGSSGYILDDVKRSLAELRDHYANHYKKVQNAEIAGLTSRSVLHGGKASRINHPAVEALLSNRGVDDPAVAETLKVLIRM